VVEAGKRGATVRALERAAPAPETRVRTVLAAAVLKGDKVDDVVRDAVMLGVDAIQPLVTARTEIAVTALARGHRVERWQRVAVASVKQCGRAVVPPVLEPLTLERYMAAGAMGAHIMCVEPSAAMGGVVTVRDVPAPAAAHLVVGPEGGWTPAEVERAAAAHWVLLSLGARTLRADAVPLVALSALLAMWSEL
jgi:16S rRNA (uracil1498-N3)-methyltransferase